MTRAPETTGEEPAFSGKTFLRQKEFRERRALQAEPRELALEGSTVSPYLRGAEAKESLLEEEPPPSEVAWRPLGPAGIPDGQTYGSGPGGTTTVAGRVAAIGVDPDDSAHLLVGAAAGGIWETRDTGAPWTPRGDDQPTLSIGALAFAPTDSSRVYAGTGEGNSGYSQLGQGLLKSDDGGSTWTVVAREIFAGIGFYRLVVDPRERDRLLVATTGGAAVSTEAGQGGWALLHQGMTWDVSLAYHGDEPEILLAAPDGLFAARGGAALAPVQLPGLPPSLDRGRERMAVAHVAADPGQAFVFAAAGGSRGPAGWTAGQPYLWHREGVDEPFVPVPLPDFGVGRYVKHVLSVDQASYDWHASVPPDASDTIYLGAIELVKGVRSADGWNWSDISSRQGRGDSIHPDQHTMAFDPRSPGVIYAGNDGGIFRSPDGGDSWQSLNDGLGISEVEYMTQRPDEATWILAGLQDNGTVRREGEGEWTQVGLGDGGDCGTNMTDPDTCFHSYYYMYMERSTRRGDANSWREVTPPGSNGVAKLFYPPLEVNADTVVKAGDVVFLSTDRGSSWAHVALPQSAEGRSVASGLAIPTPDRVIAGTIWGDVFRTVRDGGGWGAPDKLTRPKDGWISDLLVDANFPTRYWATFSSPGAVLRSDDEGATWADVTANLPEIPVNAIVTDQADRDRVWVACDVGVFESRDAGGSWAVFGTGLPNALAEDLVFHAADRLLRVGTRSRGVWEAAVD